MTERKLVPQATVGNIPDRPSMSHEELVEGVKSGKVDALSLKPDEFFALQQDEAFQTPLMRQYNKLVNDDARLNVTILASMKKMIEKQTNPLWSNYEGTLAWQTWAMNLTEPNKAKVKERWDFLYTQLMSADLDITPTKSETVEAKPAQIEAPKKGALSPEEEKVLDDLLSRKYSSGKS